MTSRPPDEGWGLRVKIFITTSRLQYDSHVVLDGDGDVSPPDNDAAVGLLVLVPVLMLEALGAVVAAGSSENIQER